MGPLVRHTRFLLTSLYKDLYAIHATNYSIQPTQWAYFLSILNDDATISIHNNLHLPMGAHIVEFKHTNTSSTAQGGGGSFKKRKTIGEIGGCESRMSKQKH